MDKASNNRQVEELLKVDFSSESGSKEETLNQLLLKLDNQKYFNKENSYMKRLSVRPIFVAAAILVLIIGFAMTSYAQGFYKIIKEVFVGEYAKYTVMEQIGTQNVPGLTPDLAIPDEQKDKIYDKDGNILEQFPETGDVFNQNGEVLGLYSWPSEDGTVITKALTQEEFLEEYNEHLSSEMTTLTNPEEARPYLAFDFSLPSHLPEGYAFDKIQLYNDENGEPVENCEYAEVSFSNGEHAKDIHLQLRLMNEETSYETDFDNFEEIKIEGNSGVIGEGSIDMEIDGVMYMFSAGAASGIDKGQLIEMVESIKR